MDEENGREEIETIYVSMCLLFLVTVLNRKLGLLSQQIEARERKETKKRKPAAKQGKR